MEYQCTVAVASALSFVCKAPLWCPSIPRFMGGAPVDIYYSTGAYHTIIEMTYCVICVAEDAAAGWPTTVERESGFFFFKKIKNENCAHCAQSRG